MKLLLCEECHDVVALRSEVRHCACGASWGRYLEDGLHAEIGGAALVIGVDNFALGRVLDNRWRYPNENLTIGAWIMGEGARHVKRDPST